MDHFILGMPIYLPHLPPVEEKLEKVSSLLVYFSLDLHMESCSIFTNLLPEVPFVNFLFT